MSIFSYTLFKYLTIIFIFRSVQIKKDNIDILMTFSLFLFSCEIPTIYLKKKTDLTKNAKMYTKSLPQNLSLQKKTLNYFAYRFEIEINDDSCFCYKYNLTRQRLSHYLVIFISSTFRNMNSN